MFARSHDVPTLFRQMDLAMKKVLSPWCKRIHYLMLDEDLLSVFKHQPEGRFMIKEVYLHSKDKLTLVHLPHASDYDVSAGTATGMSRKSKS